MNGPPEQRCSLCDATTGRCEDDSIYDEETELPICDECFSEKYPEDE
jgi:hypothetical protein